MGNFCPTIIENRSENHSSFLQGNININTDRFQLVISYGKAKTWRLKFWQPIQQVNTLYRHDSIHEITNDTINYCS